MSSSDGTLSSSATVVVEGLRVVRGGREILHGIDAVIPRGAITGLVGPSGSGKSTLIRCVVGVQVVSAGRVTVLGHPAGSPALRRVIGYSTQAPAVYLDLTLVENLRYFAAVRGDPTSDVQRVIDQVGLAQHADQLVGRLSGGELSRASVAVALLGASELIVLDEPTVGLDPVLRAELWQLFHEIAADGATLLISSHVMDEAARCDQLMLLRDGSLLAHDAPDALMRRTGASDAEQAFVRLVEGSEVARS
jgi:ABC-2 type transport system ATP-binding protein